MAHELGPFGITVNCIAPGFVLLQPDDRAAVGELRRGGPAGADRGIATRRLGEPEDIANGVQFFVAERSGWVTGQVIAIDGGSAFL